LARAAERKICVFFARRKDNDKISLHNASCVYVVVKNYLPMNSSVLHICLFRFAFILLRTFSLKHLHFFSYYLTDMYLHMSVSKNFMNSNLKCFGKDKKLAITGASFQAQYELIPTKQRWLLFNKRRGTRRG